MRRTRGGDSVKIIAKTGMGFLVECSDSELVAMKGAAPRDAYDQRSEFRIGTEINVAKIAEDARTIRHTKESLANCVNTLRSVADMIAAQPCYVKEPDPGEAP